MAPTAAGCRPLGVDRALRDLLGRGGGACLEVGCGTGVRAERVRELGRPGSCAKVGAGAHRRASLLLRRVRRPQRSRGVAIGPGYLDGHRARASRTDQGVRARVGATHRPLPELLHAFLDAARP